MRGVFKYFEKKSWGPWGRTPIFEESSTFNPKNLLSSPVTSPLTKAPTHLKDFLDPAIGGLSFHQGLREIGKVHSVEPDPSRDNELISYGFPKEYTTVALQLSDNNTDSAYQLKKHNNNNNNFNNKSYYYNNNDNHNEHNDSEY